MRVGAARDALDTRSLLQGVRQRLMPASALALVNSLLLAIPVVALAVMGYRRRWVSEDAFISLRVVDQILAGNGPVYNAGERVEAHTNPLWVAILTIAGVFGGDLPVAAVYLGIVFAAAGLLAGIAGAVQLDRYASSRNDDRPALLIPVGALVFVAIPVAWDFVTSGLESGLGFGWLGISFWLLVHSAFADRDSPPWQWYGTAVVLGLGPLVRPDFAIYSAGFLIGLFFIWLNDPENRFCVRRLLFLGAAAAILPVGYQTFRMGYYAALVPNTALAKEAGETNWEQGQIYLRDFVDPYWLWVPIAIILSLWAIMVFDMIRRRYWSGVILFATPVLTAALHATYVVRVGGDFMHGRLLLPALFTLLLPLAAVRVPFTPRPRVLITGLAVAALLFWSIISATTLRWPHGSEVDEETGIVDERAFYVDETGHPNPVTTDDYAQNGFRWLVRGRNAREWTQTREPAVVIQNNIYPMADSVPDEIRLVIPAGNIGILGYAAGPSVHIVDRLGLADPIGSRMVLEERGRPGHEKALPMVWVSARFTGVETEAVDNEAFKSVRRVLACGQLTELIEATTAPLTASRFIENIKLSWSLHSLRIPPDPWEAEERFCAGAEE